MLFITIYISAEAAHDINNHFNPNTNDKTHAK